MAWVAAIPAAVSLFETMMSKSGDDATAAAGRAKIQAMQQGANQLSQYRPDLEKQMMQAMNNRMSAYGGANNVLQQMYGGHSQFQNPPAPINPAIPKAAQMLANQPPQQQQQQYAPQMGFGGAQPGGLPMPSQLRRAV